MGALHRQGGSHDRQEKFCRVGAAQRAPEKVRLRAGPRSNGCEGIARQEVERTAAVARETTAGRSSPLGATLSPEGANFSVYSKHATGIELLLFDGVDDARPARVIRLDPSTNRTYHY